VTQVENFKWQSKEG